jgi:hypothetical protein
LYSDHEALKHLNSQDKLSARHAKWVAFVQQFSFTIKHKSGALNKVADALSRKTSLLTTMKSEVIGFELLKDSLSTDPFFDPILEDVSTRAQGGFVLHNGFLFKGTQLCIPEGSLRLKIIKEHHDVGHMGRDKNISTGGRTVLLAEYAERSGQTSEELQGMSSIKRIGYQCWPIFTSSYSTTTMDKCEHGFCVGFTKDPKR